MTAPLDDLTVKVSDLVDRPGASRAVNLALPVPDGFDLPLAAVGAPVRLEGLIESVVDGLLVRGHLDAEVVLSCARCLTPIVHDAGVDVVELFADPAQVDPDDEVEPGYELLDGHLRLDALVRDGLATTIPFQPLCAGSCRGLCAQCGTDLNEVTCGCADEALDPRWEGLRGLRLPE